MRSLPTTFADGSPEPDVPFLNLLHDRRRRQLQSGSQKPPRSASDSRNALEGESISALTHP